MDAVPSAEIAEGRGLVGNADKGGRRQVTVIESEAWQKMMDALGADLPGSGRRANLMLSGIRLEESRGWRLHIGEAAIEILGETRPCERMDEAFPGLRREMATEWRGGVFGTVVKAGTIRVGDGVVLLPDVAHRGDSPGGAP
jgi:MOSC domain-containing protein YiiM